MEDQLHLMGTNIDLLVSVYLHMVVVLSFVPVAQAFNVFVIKIL